MFAYSFLAMTAYNILKPITKSKAIDHLGADNLPWVLLGSSVLIGVLMHLYGSAARRLPRQHVVPLTQSAIIALLGVFWVLLKTEAVWVTIALYVFGQILGILLISQFWTLANDVYDARQAKRLFGLIGGGACLGGALGNSITKFTIRELGSNNLLLVSAAILAACVAIVLRIARHRTDGQHAEFDEDRGVGGREALRLLAQSRQLRVLAAVVGLAVMGAAVVDQQLSMAAEAFRVDEESIADLLAEVGAYLSIAGFVVQVGLTSRIHRSWGITAALLLLPVGLGASATLILLTGVAHGRGSGTRAGRHAALLARQDHARSAVPPGAGRTAIPRQALHRCDDGEVRQSLRCRASPRADFTVGARARVAKSELRQPGHDRGLDCRGARGVA